MHLFSKTVAIRAAQQENISYLEDLKLESFIQ